MCVAASCVHHVHISVVFNALWTEEEEAEEEEEEKEETEEEAAADEEDVCRRT
jgi:hypothetical protein